MFVFVLALAFALPIANGLLRTPVQVADALDEIVDAQASPSWPAAFRGALEDRAHLRPLRVAQTKMLLDLSGGHYRATFRGFHAGLLISGTSRSGGLLTSRHAASYFNSGRTRWPQALLDSPRPRP